MKKIWIFLLLIMISFSQVGNSYIYGGLNIGQYDLKGELGKTFKDNNSFRIGLKAVSSSWFHMDIEYASYSLKQQYGEVNASYEIITDESYISLVPKLAIHIFDLVYFEGGIQLGYQLSNKVTIKSQINGEKNTETDKSTSTEDIRLAIAGEVGIFVFDSFIISGFYEYGLEEFKIGDQKTRLNAVGVRLGINL